MSAQIESQEALNKFVADATKRLAGVENLAERMTASETLSKQLMAKIDDVHKARQEPYVADGPEGEVTRRYTMRSGNREELDEIGGVHELGKPGGVTATRRWLGSPGGVIRMLGGIEGGYYEPGLLDDPKPATEWQHELQRRVDAAAWVKAVKGAVPTAMRRSIQRHIARGPAAVAKVFADNAGEGGEWIITLPLTELERTAELERRLEGLVRDMSVSSTSMTMPFLTTGVQPFIHNVPATGDLVPQVLPKSVPTTADRTLTIKSLTVNLPMDMDAAEDSIVDFAQLANQLVAEALRDGTEDAMINGDTAASHGDTGLVGWNPRNRWSTLGASGDHRKAWIGWRQRAFDVDGTVTTAAQDFSGTQTVAAYIGALAGLSSPHAFGDVVYITSPEHYLAKIITDANVLTVDKYGPSAVVLTGEVGRIGGRPLILSEFVDVQYNTAGIYDNSTKTKTGMLLVNLARFVMARRRARRISVETVQRENTAYVVASDRKGLNTFDHPTNVANCMWLYNLSPS